MNRKRNRLATFAIALGLLGAPGCGQSGPKTHAVRGKVSIAGGAQQLAGHHVEAALDTDPTVRAYGVIAPDGTFKLETLHAGTIIKGAQEGTYRVRIIPAGEGEKGQQSQKPPVAARHLKFETSGLTFQVPACGDVTLEVSSR
jgi:hypothetical protein